MSTVTCPSNSAFKCSIKNLPFSVLIKNPPLLGSLKSISKASSLKISNCFRASAMAVYKVKLIGPQGEEHEFDAPEDTPTFWTQLRVQALTCLALAELGHVLHALARLCRVPLISLMDPSSMNHRWRKVTC